MRHMNLHAIPEDVSGVYASSKTTYHPSALLSDHDVIPAPFALCVHESRHVLFPQLDGSSIRPRQSGIRHDPDLRCVQAVPAIHAIVSGISTAIKMTLKFSNGHPTAQTEISALSEQRKLPVILTGSDILTAHGDVLIPRQNRPPVAEGFRQRHAATMRRIVESPNKYPRFLAQHRGQGPVERRRRGT